jgi:hypothetical protein
LGDAGALVLQVGVGVDQTGQDILARRVDLHRSRTGLRSPPIPSAHRDRVERDDLGDRVAFDDDVERPAGRRSVAVGNDRVADDEPGWACATDRRNLGRGRNGGGQQNESSDGSH